VALKKEKRKRKMKVKVVENPQNNNCGRKKKWEKK